jgi:NADPH-dependent 2,4-dienoyl-CoA reductase/sulfur reductase-like enzyme
MRFPLELVEAAKKRVGPEFPIIFRYSVEHYIPDGRGIEESQEMARRLEAGGVDAIDVNVACYESMDTIWPNTYHMAEAPFAELAAAIKKEVSIPVIVAGNMTPEAAESVLENGQADFIISGRDLLADPDWPNKVRRGHREDVRPCIRCNEYCIGHVLNLKTVTCTVNPRCCHEWYYDMRKAETAKKVLVIGGGPAGMEAARVAALRGHSVTLMEKENALGGQLRAAATPTFKRDLRKLVDWWATQLRKSKVDVHLDTEVTPATLANTQADAVVVACGARPLRPPIPGIEGENVVEVLDYHLETKPVRGQNIVVAGGGLSGCDAALDLAMQGKTVTIVEMLDDVAADLNFASRMTLMRRLDEQDVRILTKHEVKEFQDNGLLAQGPDGEDRSIEGDTVIVAFGMEPDTSLVEDVKEKWDEVYTVGDCVEPAKIGEAVHAGFGAAWQL